MAKTIRIIAALAALGSAAPLGQADAFQRWRWHYRAPGIEARGTFTTKDRPDKAGFYRIVAIEGNRNGVRITALEPAGRPIPGNAPYAIDNLVRAEMPQLTKAGFGFALANRDFANPFHLNGVDTEYLSVPPYKPGAGPEGPVSFQARLIGKE